ncbi:UNVERIFIED_CONTAM: hypothetical protein HDU68_004654 [Siphonaria sp. JEL0065]|nr:hypothetical protein HDU68_004654 [Siphonaria sp. JEL0065]
MITSGWIDAYDLEPLSLSDPILICEGLDECVFVGKQSNTLVAVAVSNPSNLSMFSTTATPDAPHYATVPLVSNVSCFGFSRTNLCVSSTITDRGAINQRFQILQYQLSDIISMVTEKLHIEVTRNNKCGFESSRNNPIPIQKDNGTMLNNLRRGTVVASGLSPILKLVGGYSHFLALCKDGNVLSWSDGSGNGGLHGQLGNGSMVMKASGAGETLFQSNSDTDHVWMANGTQFVDALLGLRVTDIACGGNHSVVIVDDCFVYTFGSNSHAQLGRRSKNTANFAFPTPLNFDFGDSSGFNRLVASCGDRHTVVACERFSGGGAQVWGWGDNEWGALTGSVAQDNDEKESRYLIKKPLRLEGVDFVMEIGKNASGTVTVQSNQAKYNLKMSNKNSRILSLINYRLRITINDGRTLVGQMLAFDKHMNLVLSDCEEFRKLKGSSKEEKRTLGLVVLRGETVVSMSIEAPPPASAENKPSAAASSLAGPGLGRPAGRGLPMAPQAGLQAPVRGLGGPSAAAMAPPTMYGRPPAGLPGMPPPGMPGMPPMGRGGPPMPFPGGRGAPMMPPPGFPPGWRPPQ